MEKVIASEVQAIEKPAKEISKAADYAVFIKLRLSSLVVFSAVIGYFIGIRQLQLDANWIQITALILGGFLVTGSSNGFNQVIERNTDKLMTRTQNRPVAQGRMSVREGIILASVMGVAGIFMLSFYL